MNANVEPLPLAAMPCAPEGEGVGVGGHPNAEHITPISLPSPNAQRQTPNASPLQGWVVCSYRTYKGKKLGPYYFRKWKVAYRTHKQYIKPEDVERVKAACQVYREQQKQIKEGDRRCRIFIENWDFLGKMCLRYQKGKKVTKEQEEYILRLHKEGMHITGRPLFRPRRLFGVPTFSNYFRKLWSRASTDVRNRYTTWTEMANHYIDCLQITRNPRRAAAMTAYRILPEEIDIDLSPTDDMVITEQQSTLLSRAIRTRIIREITAA